MTSKKVFAAVVMSMPLLNSCNQPITDPIGQPYSITLEVKQDPTDVKSTQISAFVDYGGFGFVQSTVEVFDGVSNLSNLTELAGSPPTTSEAPHSKKFQKSVILNIGTEYNLKARVKWTFQGVVETLDSSIVKFKPAQ